MAVEVAGAAGTEEVTGATGLAGESATAIAETAPTGSEVNDTGGAASATDAISAVAESGAARSPAGSASDTTGSAAVGEETSIGGLTGSTDSADAGRVRDVDEASGMSGEESDCGDAVSAFIAAVAIERSGSDDAACANPGSGRTGVAVDAESSDASDGAGVDVAACAEETVDATEVAGAKMARTNEAKVANGLAGNGDPTADEAASSEVVAVAGKAFGASEPADANGMVVAKDDESGSRVVVRLRLSTTGEALDRS